MKVNGFIWSVSWWSLLLYGDIYTCSRMSDIIYSLYTEKSLKGYPAEKQNKCYIYISPSHIQRLIYYTFGKNISRLPAKHSGTFRALALPHGIPTSRRAIMGSWSPPRCIGINRDLRRRSRYRERGGAPKTRKSMSEFRGETRARVVLIGGGGAVTGTVSSLFSWVWYASRDWPPTALLLRREHLPFSSLPSTAVSSLASRARNSRRKENSFSRTPSETSPKFFSRIIDHATIVRLCRSNNPRMPRICSEDPRVFTGNSFSTRRADYHMTRGESVCVCAKFFNFIRQNTYVTRISRKRRLLCGCFSWRRTVDVTKLGV